MKILFITILLVGITACSTNKVKHIDTSLDYKGQINEGSVGLKSDEAVIQDKKQADDALRIVQWKNYDLESDLNYEQSMVSWCYSDLADPRLGGNGEVVEVPSSVGMKPLVKVKEELGLDENNNLVVVKTMDFKEKMDVEKKYTETLELMLVDAKKTRQKCERKMGYARQKVGLPTNRSPGSVKLNSSGTINEIVSKKEKSLDDAFEGRGDSKKSIETESKKENQKTTVSEPDKKSDEQTEVTKTDTVEVKQ